MQKKKSVFKEFAENLTDDKIRINMQVLFVPLVLCIISFLMCIINLITNKKLLALATGIFSLLSFTAATFAYLKNIRISLVIFTVSIYLLFTYFIVFGGAEGFSPIWILILPLCGFLYYGKKRGLFICIGMFFITVFLLWTPIGQRLLIFKEYIHAFKMRFPIVYLASLLLGYFFEWIRDLTSKKLVKMNAYNIRLARHDALTGVKNRMAYNEDIHKFLNENNSPFSLIIFDVDYFKGYNDKFGHLSGDKALKLIADTLTEKLPKQSTIYRWGGEEFVILLPEFNLEKAEDTAEFIRNCIHDLNIQSGNNEISDRLTVSLGVVALPWNKYIDSDKILSAADKALYEAKNSGKNKFVSIEIG